MTLSKEAQRHKAMDALCRLKFDVFAQRAFRIVEPGSKYEWSWHLGCFPYEQKILTEHGYQQIGYLVESGYKGLVLSYNTDKNIHEWKRVTARMKNNGRPLYDMLCSTGDVLCLTDNHPVYANGKYVEADKLKAGDTLIRVRAVRQDLQKVASKTRALLQSGLLCGKAHKERELHLSKMRWQEGVGKAFLSQVSRFFSQEKAGVPLCGLRENYINNALQIETSTKNAWGLLQYEMLFSSHYWKEQPSLHRWREKFSIFSQWISTNAEEGYKAGRGLLLPLWRKAREAFGGSPYQQGQREQSVLESGYSLQTLPQSSEGNARGDFETSECFIQSITKSLRVSETVYNIEVEDNHNYFANGILVHNCIGEHLEAVYCGEIDRIIFNLPPRSLKSYLISSAYPAWVMGKHPEKKFINAGFGLEVVEQNAMKCRKILDDAWFRHCFPGLKIDPVMDRLTHFRTTMGGQYYANTSVSTMTGLGCFVAGTLVKTNKGLIPIEELEKHWNTDTLILSHDHETGEDVYKPLTDWVEKQSDKIVEVQTFNGIRFRCTPDHKVWIAGVGYIRADGLREGLSLLSYHFGDDWITSVKGASCAPVSVYDITVAGTHNYYANGVLVHNCETMTIDDPIKPMESQSEGIRNKINENIRATLLNRFDDKRLGKVCVVMQRSHEDDATGNLMKDGGWTHVKLPAEATHRIQIQLGKQEWIMEAGDLLFPARLSKKELDRTRIEMTDYHYVGQYLQEPVAVGGGEFKEEWMQYYKAGGVKPRDMNICILVDAASGEELNRKKRKTSDWTAMIVVGLASDNCYYLLDIVRDRLNPTERIDTLFMLHRKWNGLSGKPPKVGYERYGLMSDTHYIKQKMEADAYRFSLVELGGSMMKEERIRRLIPDMQMGRWWLPENLMYIDSEGRTFDLVKELVYSEMKSFPRARFDDCLDALSRIYEDDLFMSFPMPKVNTFNKMMTPPSQPDNWLDY